MNFIAIDWGSSNLRGWKIEQGECVDQHYSEQGVKQIPSAQFESVLFSFIAPWREWLEAGQCPLLMAGMVGSDVGWQDSGYQLLPLSTDEIAKGCVTVPSSLRAPIWLRPGLAVNDPHRANVMRGEEVQLLGALAMVSADIYLFPGTHSKWIQPVIDGEQIKIAHFTTVITGELYQLLMNHSLIGRGLQPGPFIPHAFAAGIEQAKQEPDGIIRQLFYGRARRLLGFMPADQVSSWLSGLLIGNELVQLKTDYPQMNQLALVGDLPLVEYYHQAAKLLDLHAVIINAQQATLNGFRRIYAAL